MQYLRLMKIRHLMLCGFLFAIFATLQTQAAEVSQPELFSCSASGVYKHPSLKDLYRFDQPFAWEVEFNKDPAEFGGPGSKEGAPLRLNIVRNGDEMSLGLHDGGNLYIASTPLESKSVTLALNISQRGFSVRCVRK